MKIDKNQLYCFACCKPIEKCECNLNHYVTEEEMEIVYPTPKLIEFNWYRLLEIVCWFIGHKLFIDDCGLFFTIHCKRCLKSLHNKDAKRFTSKVKP